jgi:phosphotransferase system enzyme I (PtsP)
MLLDLDAAKAEALLRPLVEQPVSAASVRDRLEAFATAEGLAL